jgi:prephenate dehydrogenase
MISTALFSLLRESPAWPDMGMMASSGFTDVTRLASGDPALSHGIWATNREAVIHWLDRMAERLRDFRKKLEDAQDEDLLETFAKTQIEREVFLREPPRRQAEAATPKVDTGEALMSMLVGGMMARNIKRAKEIPDLAAATPQQPGAKEKPDRRLSLGEKIAEGVKRDLEKLEQERLAKERESGKDSQ